MATQALAQQTIIFAIASAEFDENALFNNSTIQTIAANSAGGAVISAVRYYRSWDGTVFHPYTYYEITVFVPTTYTATIQGFIPTLQTAFPQYTILTYGFPVTWGY